MVPGLPAEMKWDSNSDLLPSCTVRLFSFHNYPWLVFRCSSYIYFEILFSVRKKDTRRTELWRFIWGKVTLVNPSVSWGVMHWVRALIYMETKGQCVAEKNILSWEYSKWTTPRRYKWFHLKQQGVQGNKMTSNQSLIPNESGDIV